eukprot:10721531-Lingulodinium_polyedra.AAC.1
MQRPTRGTASRHPPTLGSYAFAGVLKRRPFIYSDGLYLFCQRALPGHCPSTARTLPEHCLSIARALPD